jgi:hypothetical protein
MRPTPARLAAALLLAMLPAADAESRVVRGDASQLPPPDLSRQFERKSAEGFQKTFDARSVSSGVVETRTWGGAAPRVAAKPWGGGREDYYARTVQAGAFEARGVSDGSWATRGAPFSRGAVAGTSGPYDPAAMGVRPEAVSAEAVEPPPELGPEAAKARFRVTTPVMQADAQGKPRERGQATVEREAAPVRVGAQAVEGIRGPPGRPAPQTPAASK